MCYIISNKNCVFRNKYKYVYMNRSTKFYVHMVLCIDCKDILLWINILDNLYIHLFLI